MIVYDSISDKLIDVCVVKIDGDMDIFYGMDEEYKKGFVDCYLRNIGEFEKRDISVLNNYLDVNEEVFKELGRGERIKEIDGLIDNMFDDFYYENDLGDSYLRVVR